MRYYLHCRYCKANEIIDDETLGIVLNKLINNSAMTCDECNSHEISLEQYE